MKDLMAAVAGLFGKRYSARQKARFLRYMENRAGSGASNGPRIPSAWGPASAGTSIWGI